MECCADDSFKIKSGFTGIESRWISCVFLGHENGDYGMKPAGEPVGLRRNDCLQGYVGDRGNSNMGERERMEEWMCAILTQECTKLQRRDRERL